ncbi:MAG: YhdH/YhfP family quinone oxidoreductase [Bacteroidales bacterium]
MDIDYRALLVTETAEKQFERNIVTLNTRDLPDHDVLIKVHYSGINYKDALSAYGNKGVTRKYPFTPGIDAAGVVKESRSENFKQGDKVITGGYDLGMNTPGGYGGYIKVPSTWLTLLPEWMSLKESMIIGGRGFTAALAIMNLVEQGVKPDDGPVLVTGAAGGVGSWAVLILKKLCYNVIAGTSRIDDSAGFIEKLGADSHADKSLIDDDSGKPLLNWRWAGAIDNVGGNVLATALKACKPGGTVISCGNIYSQKLDITVFPFILNAVKLIGISTQNTSPEIRKVVWNKFRNEYRIILPDITREITLDELPEALEIAINKKNRGQVILRHD